MARNVSIILYWLPTLYLGYQKTVVDSLSTTKVHKISC